MISEAANSCVRAGARQHGQQPNPECRGSWRRRGIQHVHVVRPRSEQSSSIPAANGPQALRDIAALRCPFRRHLSALGERGRRDSVSLASSLSSGVSWSFLRVPRRVLAANRPTRCSAQRSGHGRRRRRWVARSRSRGHRACHDGNDAHRSTHVRIRPAAKSSQGISSALAPAPVHCETMKPETRSFYARAIQRAIGHIVGNLDDALDFETLARDACLSPFHFPRVFRGMVGETPLELIRRLRMKRAAWHLLDDARPITGIAFDAGYETHEAFTRAFRTCYNTPPSGFRSRRSHRIEIAAACGVHFTPDGGVPPFIPRDSGGHAILLCPACDAGTGRPNLRRTAGRECRRARGRREPRLVAGPLRRRSGGDRRTITLDGATFTIVGVTSIATRRSRTFV